LAAADAGLAAAAGAVVAGAAGLVGAAAAGGVVGAAVGVAAGAHASTVVKRRATVPTESDARDGVAGRVRLKRKRMHSPFLVMPHLRSAWPALARPDRCHGRLYTTLCATRCCSRRPPASRWTSTAAYRATRRRRW